MRLISLIIKVLASKKSPLSQGEILEAILKDPLSKECEELNRVDVPLSAVARQLTKYSSGASPILVKVEARKYQLVNKDIPIQSQSREIDFHPALVNFAFQRFNAYCKTVNAVKILKKRNNTINKWANPDIVGIDPALLKFNNLLQSEVEKLGMFSAKVLQFYSFELKVKIDKTNLTEAYFQAVSNSSWANFGYLVVGDLNLDNDFVSNLVRLNNGYGIGVIHVNLQNPVNSQIIVSARQREVVDLNFINFLSGINKDFYNLIQNSGKIIKYKNIDLKNFDKINIE